MEKVLCVDDNLSILYLYQDELSEEGYEVILATGGREALMKFEKDTPHLAVMDIRIPDTDVTEILTTMQIKNPGIPVILNTAYLHYPKNLMALGAEACVFKSADLTELKRKIREALEKRRISRRE